MRMFVRAMKVLSLITLFFFCWTFMPIYEVVAWAATPQSKRTADKVPGNTNALIAAQQGSGERFEKALDRIRENIQKAENNDAKSQDITSEMAEVKATRAEIDSLDVELRKEFSATETKLKDAGLSKEILDRHAKFVKRYDDNLRALRVNLDGVEMAPTKADRKAALENVKLHLEKVKPKKKHLPLDPNNLPHRTVKAKERAPRLKKEEFEKEFGPQSIPGGPKTADGRMATDVIAASEREWVRTHKSPVLLAFNGPVSDIPLSLGSRDAAWGTDSGTLNSAFPAIALNSALSTLGLMYTQAISPPTSADLAETLEVQFTPVISAKALELDNSPVKIYEWVRNNIDFVPTYGSIQGAEMCLQTKRCNAFDTASLLIALLRVSNIPAKYVYGTIEVPVAKALNWVGGATEAKMAGTILVTNGIPAYSIVSGGVIKSVQLEHVWVSAWIDYNPSRGAIHKQGDTWLSLDASYKQYSYSKGIDLNAAVPFNGKALAEQIISSATYNETEQSLTNLNSALMQQAMQNHKAAVKDYVQSNHPGAKVGDILGKKEIISQEFPFLLGTLPYRTVLVGSQFAQIPDNLRAGLSFHIQDPLWFDTMLNYSVKIPYIAGKKLTLSFAPATANDEKIIQSYLPKPHADGSPILLSELPKSFPAYLINLKPELRIEGQTVATGLPTSMGARLDFAISISEPGFGADNVNNIITAGEYFGIGLDTGKISQAQLNALKAKLELEKAKYQAQSAEGLGKDDIVGDILHSAITIYLAEVDAVDEILALAMDIIRHRTPSLGMFSQSLVVDELFGIPRNASPNGMVMDVDRLMLAVFDKQGHQERVRQFMLASGSSASALEHSVPEQLFSTAENPAYGISAVKALQLANSQGIPIYSVDRSNVNAVLPKLLLDAETKTDIQNAVYAGKVVTVPKQNISYSGWTGCGYIVTDPLTGAGAYMISGGYNGGMILTFLGALLIVLGMFFIPVLAGLLPFLIISLGLHAFIIGLLLHTSDFTSQDWSTFINGFVETVGLLLGVAGIPAVAGLLALSTFAVPLLWIGLAFTILSWLLWAIPAMMSSWDDYRTRRILYAASFAHA